MNHSSIARFEGVFNHLLDILPSVDKQLEMAKHARLTPKDPGFYREFRTIGFQVPRQLGKTAWLEYTLDRDRHAFLLTKDDLQQRAMVARDRGLLGKVMGFSSIVNNTVELPHGTTTLFVDEATYLLGNSVRRSKFYEFVAAHGNPNLLIVLVG